MNDRAFAAARERMVRDQCEAHGIVDRRVLEAMQRVPRHRFVPPDLIPHAYEDRALMIGLRQTISQPFMVALMTQCLALSGAERVLEVGTGSGYQAAVLSLLAQEVVTIERHIELAAQARKRLVEVGAANVTVVIGDGSEGYADAAPYDRILVTAAAPRVPEALLSQLAAGGRLVAPVGGSALQTLIIVTRDTEGRLSTQEYGVCAFVPLIGVQGWPDSVVPSVD
jgi:protein-L-isoaspartate(D-aspartate) O-methyltransferase